MLFRHDHGPGAHLHGLELVEADLAALAFGGRSGLGGFLLLFLLGLGGLFGRSFLLQGLDVDAREKVGAGRHFGAGLQTVKVAGLGFQRGGHRAFAGLLAQLLQQGAGGIGHDGPQAQGHLAHGRQQHVHDRAQTRGVALLEQGPRRLRIHVLVERAHQIPQGIQALGELGVAEQLDVIGHGRGAQLDDGLVVFAEFAGLGHLALKILGRHGQHAAEQVAQVVGQVGVDAGHHAFFTEGGIGTEMHLAQQEIAEGVQTVLLAHLQRFHNVAQGFGHLGIAHQPVTVHVQVLVHGQARGLEHGGPEHGMGLEDVLGHQMFAGPEGLVLFTVGPAQSADVVQQGVEPHIADVILVEGQFDAPGQAGLGTGDAQIFQRARLQHGQHFVAVALGADEIGMALDVFPQPGQVLGHAEEVVLLADEFRLGQMLGAQAVLQLLFRIEAFAAVAVVAAELAEIDVAGIIDLLQEALHAGLVVFVGSAHEGVVLDAQMRPQLLEQAADAVHEFLGGDALLFGGLDDLVTVFVRTGQEHGVVAQGLVEARQGVGHDGGIGMSQMGLGIHIVNGGGDIKVLHV